MRPEMLALSRSTVDRDGAARAEPTLLQRLSTDPRTRVVLVDRGRVAVTADGTALDLLTVDRLGPPTLPGQPLPPVSGPPAPYVLAYLGRDGESAYLACVLPPPAEGQPDVAGMPVGPSLRRRFAWATLREVGDALGDRDAGLAVTAVALESWHDRHRYCPRCGTATEIDQAGWTRRCRADGSEHYPRTDPAVIVAVTDAGGRLLLAHARAWPAGRFSLIAGFVEPGESLEAAVRREVREECGLEVSDLAYLASQPWPFPSSLMVGFRATVSGGRLEVDDDEITEAMFVGRRELAVLVAGGSLLLPSRSSIARAMIEEWFGQRLPGA